jgi:hypothetical protein
LLYSERRIILPRGKIVKKLLLVATVVLALASPSVFAATQHGWAVGGEAVFPFAGSSLPSSGMINFKFTKIPIMFAVGISTAPALGITADYWFANERIADVFDWYAGVGGYMTINWNPNGLAVGGRIPLGLQAWPFGRNLEIFVEIAPAVGVSLVPTAFDWHLQGALGLRFWF